MREFLKKISATLLLAVAEIALGILLLISPSGFTMAVVIAVNIILIISGLVNVVEYLRLPKEEAMQTWKFSSGAAGITLGVLGIIYRQQILQEFGMLVVVYGITILLFAFLKLQIAVDAMRAHIHVWYLMCFSFLATTGIGLLLFFKVIKEEKTAWLVTGIALIGIAIFDAVYFILGHKPDGKGSANVPAVVQNDENKR
ncbi:MAG: DUF308 domain-containing protein [Clostridiales bacterium]|nr:DUF308 domain-containing protein [Clostridiales bacterium]